MYLDPTRLTPVLTAHAKMRAVEKLNGLNLPVPAGLLPEGFSTCDEQAFILYEAAYNNIQKELGYLSALDAYQFAIYLDTHTSHIKSIVSNEYGEEIVNHLDLANYHFQLQTYIQIAKVSGLAILLVLSLVTFAVLLPEVIVPATASFLSLSAISQIGCVMAGTIAALTGYGLFGAANKINPSAEELIVYQPSL